MSVTLSIAALLTLKDQFSAPMRQAQNALGGLNDKLRSVQGTARRVSEAMRGVSDAASRLATTSAQIAAAGQLATGFGLESYVRESIDVEHRMAALGNTANMSADDLRTLNERLTAASRATNQFKADLLTANEQLIAAGMQWQQALDITPVLGEVATATQASMGDLAQTAYALSSNMRIPAEQMQAAFERLTVAGQSGQFELKDMAREFDKLGASMGALKFTGLENVSRLGAALQIARRGAGDASEAANNLQNFLAKLASPDVQKSFAKFGIDLPRLLKRARDEGLDPFLVTLKAIQEATGGDEFKLGELFGDMQVQNFIKPMLLYADDYKKLVAEIDSANGVIEGNFTRMMGTTAERWKQFRIQLETTPMPWVDELIDRLSALLETMNQYPRVASAIAGGFAGIAAAAIALKASSVVISGLAGLLGLGQKMSGWLRGKGGAPGGGLLGSLAGGVQKVWVVNMPGGGLGDMLPDMGRAGGRAGQGARTMGSRIRSVVAGGWMQLTLAWQSLTSWGARLMGVASRVGSALLAVGRSAWMILSPVAKVAAAFAAGWAVGKLISTGIDALLTKILGRQASLGTAIYDGVQAIKGAWNDGMSWLSELPGRMMTIGGQIVDGLISGLRERAVSLKESVTGMASDIGGWFKDRLGIHSPSRVFAELGAHLMGGLQLGIERTAGLPLAAMRVVAAALAGVSLTAAAPAMAVPSADWAPRAIRYAVEPAMLPPQQSTIVSGIDPYAAAVPMTASAAPINITVNLNGPAGPETAQDVAATVRREVERLLAEQARRDTLARRARMIDGGIS